MDIITTRFGTLSVQPEDELFFAQGLIGLEHCQRWVVLSDGKNPALGWLQSVEQAYIALGVVSPRRFVPDYQLRVDARDLQSLELTNHGDAEVAVIASRNEGGLTLNLRAPLVIDVAHRRGCQVVAKDAHPIQFPLQTATNTWKKTA